MTADGHALAAGERVPGDGCQVCDATTGRIMPRWHDHCGVIVEHTYSPSEVLVASQVMKVGGDVDADGIADMLSADRSRLSGAESEFFGILDIFNLKSGDVLYQLVGTTDNPIGGALDIGGDVDGDGRADLLFTETYGTFAGGLDVDGGPDEPHGAPNVVHMRSIASGEDIWTLTGPGGCHALGARGRFVSDYDGDGTPDVVLVEPGCVTGNTTAGTSFGAHGGDDSGRLELHSGVDGHMIRSWAAGEHERLWGAGFYVGVASDQDGDGHPELLVYTGRRGSVELEVQVYSVASDTPIARWYPERITGGRHNYVTTNLTSNGETSFVSVESNTGGLITLTIQSDLSALEPSVDTISFRIPRGSHTQHIVWYYGHGDVDGNGTQEVILLDRDRERGNSGAARLLAVTLDGRVLWLSPYDTLLEVLVQDGVVDLDGDGRVDFVSAGPGFAGLHLDLSSGFAVATP